MAHYFIPSASGPAYLKVVGLVVVHVERPEEFCIPAHRQLLGCCHPLVDGLPGKLLHLDVVELPKVAEPLDQLWGDAPVKLWENKHDFILLDLTANILMHAQ